MNLVFLIVHITKEFAYMNKREQELSVEIFLVSSYTIIFIKLSTYFVSKGSRERCTEEHTSNKTTSLSGSDATNLTAGRYIKVDNTYDSRLYYYHSIADLALVSHISDNQMFATNSIPSQTTSLLL